MWLNHQYACQCGLSNKQKPFVFFSPFYCHSYWDSSRSNENNGRKEKRTCDKHQCKIDLKKGVNKTTITFAFEIWRRYKKKEQQIDQEIENNLDSFYSFDGVEDENVMYSFEKYRLKINFIWKNLTFKRRGLVSTWYCQHFLVATTFKAPIALDRSHHVKSYTIDSYYCMCLWAHRV